MKEATRDRGEERTVDLKKLSRARQNAIYILHRIYILLVGDPRAQSGVEPRSLVQNLLRTYELFIFFAVRARRHSI